MNVSDSKIEDLYSSLVDSTKEFDAKIRDGEAKLEKLNKQAESIAQRKEKLEAELKEWRLSRNAKEQKTFREQMQSYHIDMNDAATMKKIMNVVINAMGKPADDDGEKAADGKSSDGTGQGASNKETSQTTAAWGASA